jgi:hypothetical protein
MGIFAFIAQKMYNFILLHSVQKGQIQECNLNIFLIDLVIKNCTVVKLNNQSTGKCLYIQCMPLYKLLSYQCFIF